jgi:hypothetical protein
MFDSPLDALSEDNSIVTKLKGYSSSGDHGQGHPGSMIYLPEKKEENMTTAR